MPTYTGTSGADTFAATDNQDWIIAGLGGADVLSGSGGNDSLSGDAGNDMLSGGDGDDSFLIGAGHGFDSIDGGIGYDAIKALTDNVTIGVKTLSDIEEISANGYAGVTVSGDSSDNVFDFSNVLLTGIGQILGGGGNDTIIGNALAANVIDGGTGNDIMVGGAADDIFYVSKNAGFDSFDGSLGNDMIVAAEEGAKISFGAITHVETISGAAFFSTQIIGTTADDLMDFSTITLQNIANVDAGDGNDTMIGTATDNTLSGGDGDDIIDGGAGNDTLSGGKGHDVLNGGSGDDSFTISGGADVYKGGSGYDALYAAQNGANLQLDTGVLNGIEEISANGFVGMTISAANAAGSTIDLRRIFITDDDIASINGGNGADTIFGSKTYDYIFAGLGDDTVNGFLGDDEIHGGGGHDTIMGGNGYDVIFGDAGNDILNGGAQDDIIWGGSGDDMFIAGANSGYDEYHGENGIDTLVAEAGQKIIRATKIDGIETISWDGSKLVTIQGGFGDEIFDFNTVSLVGVSGIKGGTGNDIIHGSSLGDVINGEVGVDTLSGGLGDDIITGDVDFDFLTGGLGNDIFRDTAASLSGDMITDFTAGDAIQIINAKDFTKVVLSYTDDGSGLAGTLHVDGVGGLAGGGIDIHLIGAYSNTTFQVTSDGANGALILI
ncbi:MAG: hypothetical protein KA533_03460 [Sphingobium sp.]|nr:hypothetical protein [Sphingobium sp.]MBP6111540.1 hypothetical protein [Sphingobium sp.]MBP8670531.1 hypothetical protein [Sphingobium sp.]MBP9157272.1 hypothetical protein [Sphingobium sp.]MCC6483093.1 hypothetical protein [Sphingomonadaceae bacterium]